MLDTRRLSIFRAVADYGSFSAAALELRYTPSAVSQQIATLEREVGLTLLARHARGTRLTEAGELLLMHARVVLERLDLAGRELNALGTLESERVRLASFLTASQMLVPRAAGEFRARHPNVELTLIETDPLRAIDQIKDGSADVAIVYSYNGSMPVLDDAEVTFIELFRERVHVVLPAWHPLADVEELQLAQLQTDPWIQAITPSCGMVLRSIAHRAGFQPRVALDTDGYGAVLESVAAGVGVALMPELALAAPPPEVVVRPVAESPVRSVVCALPLRPSPAAKGMASVLQDACDARAQASAGRALGFVG
jgi:DNA-binding transcriptional LysR family regulator